MEHLTHLTEFQAITVQSSMNGPKPNGPSSEYYTVIVRASGEIRIPDTFQKQASLMRYDLHDR
jgi:hypothetical protein